MPETILDKIVQDKNKWILIKKKQKPLISFKKHINTKTRDFYDSLKEKKPFFILECKKASPSLGIIRKNFNLIEIANIYKKYATAISVLTDEKYFHGDFKFIDIIRKHISQPILCKDFFIDPYQVYLARYYNADAILLMLSILNDVQYKALSNIAKKLNMDVLTEINNTVELQRALQLNANIIGINNRNLNDLSIDLNRTCILSSLIKKNIIIISESGITKYRHVRKLRNFVHGFLIGSHLMLQKNLEIGIKSIIIGNNKVCGLTRAIDIKKIEKYSFIYGGLIFVQNSMRMITKNTAKNIILNSELRFVGVFQNENIENVNNIAQTLSLYAVQLHGSENQQYINKLRKILPVTIQIWKAFSISKNIPFLNWKHVKMYVFDSFYGGSNTSFDWFLLKNKIFNNVILAGGINQNNCVMASQLNCSGLDLNSGVEIAPGIKDHNKIKLVFKNKNHEMPH